jgi:hypothetical protein
MSQTEPSLDWGSAASRWREAGSANCRYLSAGCIFLRDPRFDAYLHDSTILGSHKSQADRAIGAHLLFPPPYSPDLNPIEQVFGKLKHLLRKAAERTVEATWQKIGKVRNRFEGAECANYLVNSGCAST